MQQAHSRQWQWRMVGLCCAMVTPSVWALDLLEATERAVQYDPAWQARLSTHLAEQQGEAIASSALRPSLNAQLSLNRNRFDPEQQLAPTLSYTQGQAGLVGRQALYRPDLTARVRQARAAAQLSDSSLAGDQQVQQLQVAQAYLQVSQALDQQALLRAEVEALQHQYATMQARNKVGVVARVEVSEALAQLQAAQANQQAAQSAITTAQAQLAQFIGPVESSIERLSARADLDSSLPRLDWAAAERNHPRMEAARRQLALAEANVGVARRADWPQLDAVGRWSKSSTDPKGYANAGESFSAGLELNLPLWLGGSTRLQTRQTELQRDAARDQLRATELQLRTQFEANLRNLSNDQTLIRAREQAVASSDEVSRATEAGYNLGMRTQLDLLQARRNALAARQQLSDARHQYVRDYLNAHAAQGSLNRTVLQDVNRWFGDGKPSR